jgi:hypothetical protein
MYTTRWLYLLTPSNTDFSGVSRDAAQGDDEDRSSIGNDLRVALPDRTSWTRVNRPDPTTGART